jgi:hypothetical protein
VLPLYLDKMREKEAVARARLEQLEQRQQEQPALMDAAHARLDALLLAIYRAFARWLQQAPAQEVRGGSAGGCPCCCQLFAGCLAGPAPGPGGLTRIPRAPQAAAAALEGGDAMETAEGGEGGEGAAAAAAAAAEEQAYLAGLRLGTFRAFSRHFFAESARVAGQIEQLFGEPGVPDAAREVVATTLRLQIAVVN